MTQDHALVATTAPTRGTAEPFERFDAPTPGTYWRLRKTCKGRHDERLQAPAMSKGTVLMLAKIELADGEPHAYTFAAHPGMPEDERNDTVVHADDFHAWFERAPDGEAVRTAELQALLADMEHTKVQMLAPPPDAVPVALLAHDPSPAIGEPGQALATPDLLQAMTLRADRLKEDAEKRSNWIQKHSTTLGQQGTMLANFHQERAEAALARAHAQLEGVGAILKTVANLRLYTGEGIELMVLRDGAPAAADERVTIYQDVLSLDEEIAIELDAGGLDHTQTDELKEALADPALLTRLIPAQRGIVLARFRSTHKEFIKPTGTSGKSEEAVARFNSQMSDESKRKRLLVRDGERLWLIDADDVLAPIKQLMPSAGEQAGYFEQDPWDRRKPPRQITREDISYAKAQRAQLGALDHYAKVLILLMGLHDRVDLFEGARIPKFSNWLDPAFQNAFLHLVSLDTLLGEERPGFGAWQDTQNGYLAAGAWVAVDLAQSFGPERAPGAFTRGRYYNCRTHHDLLYKPDVPDGRAAVVFERVQADSTGLFIEIPGSYDGYRDRVRRRDIAIKLYVRCKDSDTGRHETSDGVLVLDRVHRADLSYYLESRVERRGYQAYLKLFRQARVWVEARDREEALLRARLRQAVLDGRLPHDPDRLDAQITHALAVARTARRDKAVPSPSSPDFADFLTAALGALHAGVTTHDARIAAIDTWAVAAGRLPLRLVLTGKESWKLYLVPTEAEHDARLGAPVHATLAAVTFTRDGAVKVKVERRALLRPVASEQVIHDWEREVPATYDTAWDRKNRPAMRPDGAAYWLTLEPTFRGTYANAVATLDAAIAQSAQLDAGLDYAALAKQAKRYMHNKSRGSVNRQEISVAIGSAMYRERPVVLLATIDAIGLAHNEGDEATKAFCLDAVQGIYRHPDNHVASLKKGFAWSLAVAPIETVAPLRKEVLMTRRVGRWVDRKQCINARRAKEKKYESVSIESLTPAGARLFPWLADLTASAIG